MTKDVTMCGGAAVRAIRPAGLRSVLLASTVLTAACGRPATVASSTPVCERIVWAAAETLRSPTRNLIYVDSPQVLQVGKAVLLLGRWALEVDSTGRLVPVRGEPDSIRGAGVLVGSDQVAQRVPLPVPITHFEFPRAVVGANNVVTVVWAEPYSADAGVRVLYSADLIAGRWTAVTAIPIEATVRWDLVNPSPLLYLADELRLVTPGLEAGAGAVLVRRTGGTWNSTPLRVERNIYSRLAPLAGDTLLIAFVTAARGDPNALFVQRLTTTGDTVGPRVRISSPGGGPVFEHRFIASGDSALFLIWQIGTSPRRAEQLGFASSRDRGATWERLDVPAIPDGFDVLRVGIDSLGHIHLALRGDRDGMPHPIHSLRTAGGWSVSPLPSMPPDVLNVGNPELLLVDPAAPRIVWGVLLLRDGLPHIGFSAVSTGRASCSSHPN